MSIERDEDFEQLEDIAAMMTENPGIEFENGKYVYYGLDPRTAFAVVYIGGAWMAWQAKAKAVPEGFALVNQKDLLELTIAINEVDLATHTESKTNEVREMWQQVALKLMALGTAQESK